MKKKIIALISTASCAAVTAGILVFNSSGGANQIGSGWYLKNGEISSEAIYVNEKSRNSPSQILGEDCTLYEGSFFNEKNGNEYVYVGEEIPCLKTGKYYVDGNTDNSYVEVYSDGTLQRFGIDIEKELWEAQGDLNGLSEEELSAMNQSIKEEAEFGESKLYYSIKALKSDNVIIMFNTKNDFSEGFYRCFFYVNSDEFTDGIGRHFIHEG